MNRREALKQGFALTAACSATGVFANDVAWPTKPVRIVVNFAPGGAVDVIGRATGQALSVALGNHPVIVENKVGAGGAIGADFVAKSEPDGHTFLVSAGTFLSIGPHIYPKLPLDPMKDLAPVAALTQGIHYLLVRADLPVKDGREFLAYLKKNSASMSYGSAGTGTGPHIAGEMLNAALQTNAVHAPYRGAAPALQDLMGGRMDFMFDPGVGLSQLGSGKIRLLAIGATKRVSRHPDVPTLDELGVTGFNAETIFGIYAPVRTPKSIVDQVNAQTVKLLTSESMKATIANMGAEVAPPFNAAAFATAMAQENQRYGAIVRQRNIKGE